MKFKCGLTEDTKARLNHEALLEALKKWNDWHDVFAWLPIKIADNDCRWLETVECRYRDLDIYNVLLWGKYAFHSPEYRAKERSGK